MTVQRRKMISPPASSRATGGRSARAVTLVESTRPDHRTIATHLIETLRGHERQALRIGLSGTPGVGKSTFIEAFGMGIGRGWPARGRPRRRSVLVALRRVDPGRQDADGTAQPRARGLHPALAVRPRTWAASRAARARRWRSARRRASTWCWSRRWASASPETMVAEMLRPVRAAARARGRRRVAGRQTRDHGDRRPDPREQGRWRPETGRDPHRRPITRARLRLLRKRPQGPEGFPKALPVSAVTGDGLEGAWDEMQTLARWRKDHGWWDRRRRGAVRALVRGGGPRGPSVPPQDRSRDPHGHGRDGRERPRAVT